MLPSTSFECLQFNIRSIQRECFSDFRSNKSKNFAASSLAAGRAMKTKRIQIWCCNYKIPQGQFRKPRLTEQKFVTKYFQVKVG